MERNRFGRGTRVSLDQVSSVRSTRIGHLRDTNALIFVFQTNNALVSLDAAGQRARRLARMPSSVAAQPRCVAL
jgi:hypothetical protein